MEGMIVEALKGEGIWTILAVFLVIYVIKDSRGREEKLMEHITKLDCSQNKIVIRLEKIEEKMNTK